MEDWTGKTIGQFRLAALIGQEPGRASYRAEASGGGEPVAVTLIAPPTADDRWFADRVARGLRSYVGITHPHLLPLREAGEIDGTAYVVTPLAEGTTLRARLGRPVPIAEVARLLAPVAAALDALHDRRLVHGDLRPERILLTSDGRVLLTDSGLAALIADAARLSPGGAEVTPEEAVYRAPESAHGAPIDGRADIYSLGIVAYEALTGRPPFGIAEAGGSAEALANLHVGSSPPAPRALNPALDAATEAALLRALAKSPYERFATATAFIEALAGEERGQRAEGRGQRAEVSLPMPVVPAPVPVAPAPVIPIPPTLVAPAVPPVSGGYTYVSAPLAAPPIVATASAPDARQLSAERTRLVNALAAITRQRGGHLLIDERQRLTETLRAMAMPAPVSRPAPPPPARDRRAVRSEAVSRPQPTRGTRPSRTWDNGRFEFRVAPGAAARALARTFGPLIGGLVLSGLIFSGLRCLLVVAVFVAIFCFLAWYSAINQTITCDQYGFSLKVGLLSGQQTARQSTWEEVRDLQYYEKVSGNKRGRTEAHFAVFTQTGKAFDQADSYDPRGFTQMIEIFTRMTPHLDYTWVPSDRTRGRLVLERRKMYSKVARVQGREEETAP